MFPQNFFPAGYFPPGFFPAIGSTPPNPGTGVTLEQIQALLATMLGPITADIAQLQSDVALLAPQQPGPIPPTSALYNPRFVNAGGVGVAQATVQVLQGSTGIGYGTTNANGRIEFTDRIGFVLLKGVTYSLRVYAAGYMAQAPLTFTLSADAAPQYQLEAVPPFPVATNPAKAIVRVRTADFTDIPVRNTKVTIALVDTKTPVIGDIIRNTRHFEGITDAQGEVDIEVWNDATLLAAKLKPTYKLMFTGAEVKIRVPPQGGLASRLLDPLG